jgi:DNA-binding LacI/PurR family transcriptional regulator
MYEIGTQTFELVSGAIDGKYSTPQSVVLPVKLVVRESAATQVLERCTA